jgi:hypothetical protein
MWVIFDQGRGLRRAAHFRFAPEADVELEYCHLSRWAKSRHSRNTGTTLLCSPTGSGVPAVSTNASRPCCTFQLRALSHGIHHKG